MDDEEFINNYTQELKRYDYLKNLSDTVAINSIIVIGDFIKYLLFKGNIDFELLNIEYGIDDLSSYYPKYQTLNKRVPNQDFVLCFNIEEVCTSNIQYLVAAFSFSYEIKVCFSKGKLLSSHYNIYFGPLAIDMILNLSDPVSPKQILTVDKKLFLNGSLPSKFIPRKQSPVYCKFVTWATIDKRNKSLNLPILEVVTDRNQGLFYSICEQLNKIDRPDTFKKVKFYINYDIDFPDVIGKFLEDAGLDYSFIDEPNFFSSGAYNNLYFDWHTEPSYIKYISQVVKVLFIDNYWARSYGKKRLNQVGGLHEVGIKIAYKRLFKSNFIYFGGLNHLTTDISVNVPFDFIENLDVAKFKNQNWLTLFPPKITTPDYLDNCTIQEPTNGLVARRGYEEYQGYNDWSDSDIDDAFDGRPDATWNVD